MKKYDIAIIRVTNPKSRSYVIYQNLYTSDSLDQLMLSSGLVEDVKTFTLKTCPFSLLSENGYELKAITNDEYSDKMFEYLYFQKEL